MTDTTTQPVVTEGAQAPLDPVIMKMLEDHVECTVWHFVDQEATARELEAKIKTEPHLAWTWNHCRAFKQSPIEIAATKAAINNISPQDAVEAMLASQLTAVHLASVECMSHASCAIDNLENRIAYLNTASKLSRTFAELTKALHHHRGKGNSQQTINVIHQHIHIDDGGQAIVGGNVTSQGRGAEKITE